MITSRERILTTHVGSLPRNEQLSELRLRRLRLRHLHHREWVIEPAVWLKLKSIRDGAG